eukprot:COSAG06_NODE_180_length_20940_cov_7.005758_10_plen_227_part_00
MQAQQLSVLCMPAQSSGRDCVRTWELWSMKNVRPSSAVRASQPGGTACKEKVSADVSARGPADAELGFSHGAAACPTVCLFSQHLRDGPPTRRDHIAKGGRRLGRCAGGLQQGAGAAIKAGFVVAAGMHSTSSRTRSDCIKSSLVVIISVTCSRSSPLAARKAARETPGSRVMEPTARHPPIRAFARPLLCVNSVTCLGQQVRAPESRSGVCRFGSKAAIAAAALA